jgi:hypothetical protein
MVMVFALILGPFILITADEALTLILARLMGETAQGFNAEDLSTISSTIGKLDNSKVTMLEYLKGEMTTLNDQLEAHRSALLYIELLQKNMKNEMTPTQLDELKNYLGDENLYNALVVDKQTGILASEIATTIKASKDAIQYLQSNISDDISNLSDTLYTLKPGEYIQSSQQAVIGAVIVNMEKLYTNINTVLVEYKKINKGAYNIARGFEVIERFQFDLTLLTGCVDPTFGKYLNELGGRIAVTETRASIAVSMSTIISECESSYSDINVAVFSQESLLTTALYGGAYNTGIIVFKNTTQAAMKNIDLVGAIYSSITGDTNPSN